MFTCEECGKEVDHLLLDGYTFGDRMLEGITFTIKKRKNGKLYCADYPKTEYTNGLNMKRWVQLCNEYLDDIDILTCPECGQDVGVNLEAEQRDIEPTVIGLSSLGDIFGKE